MAEAQCVLVRTRRGRDGVNHRGQLRQSARTTGAVRRRDVAAPSCAAGALARCPVRNSERGRWVRIEIRRYFFAAKPQCLNDLGGIGISANRMDEEPIALARMKVEGYAGRAGRCNECSDWHGEGIA